jgi:hypothetical protein
MVLCSFVLLENAVNGLWMSLSNEEILPSSTTWGKYPWFETLADGVGLAERRAKFAAC